MRVFVTGGTGLLGNTVIRQLCEQGDEVLALVRSEPDPEVFDGLDVDLIHTQLTSPHPEGGDRAPAQAADSVDSDVSNVDSLDRAIESCDAVIHSAAKIHLGWKNVEESMSVNREGTKRIAEACLRYGKRMVHIATVNTIAVGSRQSPADESTPLSHAGGQIECAYVVSKRASVQAVRDAVDRGLDSVIVHPGFMLGPWDWKPSSGRMMLEVGTGWKPVSPSGGCSLCDSRDVASGVIAAMKSDCDSGREYILAGHNLTYKQLWTEMAERMGTRRPIRAAGPGMEYLAAIAGDLWTKISGKEGDVNSAGVAMSGQFHWYSSRRAEDELAYKIRDASETLDSAAEWIRNRFVLRAKAGDR